MRWQRRLTQYQVKNPCGNDLPYIRPGHGEVGKNPDHIVLLKYINYLNVIRKVVYWAAWSPKAHIWQQVKSCMSLWPLKKQEGIAKLVELLTGDEK